MNLPHPVINISIISVIIYKHHVFHFFCIIFFSLLSISFLPGYHLHYFFSIVDSVFLFFYVCSSIALFKINQNLVILFQPYRKKRTITFSRKINDCSIAISDVIVPYNDICDIEEVTGSSLRKPPKPPRNKALSLPTSTTSCSYVCSLEDNHSNNYSFKTMDYSPPSNDMSNVPSPLTNSPWSSHMNLNVLPNEGDNDDEFCPNVLLGSLVREEGHIYSLAAAGDLLYTGSDSKNIRVWKNHREFSGFKSNSGLVKAIIICGDKIFTGHQDGKVRVWKVSSKNQTVHKRVGTLPTLKDVVKNSIRPSNYITEARRNKNFLWLKHFDAISCLGISEDGSYLYSASWDKTFKVWRISDFKCLESIIAHEDAVNALVAGFDGLVFTGSADGSVKVWRRELQGKGTKHFFSQTLLKQECAITALAVNPPEATIVYCGSSDGLVNFWERDTQLTHGGVLRGHKLAVLCLVSAGSLVFSGSADMGICVWRRNGMEHCCLSQLTGHTGPVKCLAVEEDQVPTMGGGGRAWTLYSGSLDKSVKMWRVSEQAPPMGWNNGGSVGISKPSTSTLTVAPTFSSQGNRISEAKS